MAKTTIMSYVPFNKVAPFLVLAVLILFLLVFHGQDFTTTKGIPSVIISSSSTPSYSAGPTSVSSKVTAGSSSDEQMIRRPSSSLSANFSTQQRGTKVGRLEKGLARARAAIRRAALSRNYTSDKEETFVPRGPIYHDPHAFLQSYIEMEKQFKIWTYREGEPPLVHSGPQASIYALEGHIISELEGDGEAKGPFSARRPEDAHAFFLPFSVTNIVEYMYTPIFLRSYEPLIRFTKDYIRVVAERHPYWQRSSGADHFMVACHDWGPEVTRNDPEFLGNLMRVVCNANISEGFDPRRDVSLPEVNIFDRRLSPPGTVSSPSQRPTLAFFAGGPHGYIREVLLRHWKDKDEEVVVRGYLPINGPSYQERMGKSQYCLCPSGYEVASPRLVEAIYAGCVPVIISAGYALPFSDVLNWSKFSVMIPVERIPDIKDILKAVPTSQYRKMQKRVVQVQPHFVINRPARRFDAIHMVLHSLWLRRLDLRLEN